MPFAEKIKRAISTWARLHRVYVYTGLDLPYIVHPYEVATIVSRYTYDEDVICAGFLHDVLEDGKGYTYEELRNDFGDRIASIVQGATEEHPVPKALSSDGREKEGSVFFESLRRAPTESLLICVADAIHNLQILTNAHELVGERWWTEFYAIVYEKVEFYGKILEIVSERLDSGIISELQNSYNKLRFALPD